MNARFISPNAALVLAGQQQNETIFAEHQPEYIPLRALVSATKHVSVLTRWTPSAEQRAAIAAGEDIFLECWTFGSPLQPLLLSVGEPRWCWYAPAFVRQRDDVTQKEHS